MPIREKEMELADRRVFLLPEHRDHWLRVQGENMFTANREWSFFFLGLGLHFYFFASAICDTKQSGIGLIPLHLSSRGKEVNFKYQSLYKLFCNSIFSFSFANLEVALVALRADRDGTTASEETLILRHEQFLQLHSLRIGLPAKS